LQCTRERLLQITNLGEKTVDTIYLALEKLGYYRKSRKPKDEEDDDSPSSKFTLLND
jgi:DNA-directed RNA polymerase alpha subunit